MDIDPRITPNSIVDCDSEQSGTSEGARCLTHCPSSNLGLIRIVFHVQIDTLNFRRRTRIQTNVFPARPIRELVQTMQDSKYELQVRPRKEKFKWLFETTLTKYRQIVRQVWSPTELPTLAGGQRSCKSFHELIKNSTYLCHYRLQHGKNSEG